MGVINVTPNSFSDGGKFESSIALQNQIKYFLQHGVSIFDFGAESTAPFNEAVDDGVERSRLSKIIPTIAQFKDQLPFISLDSYKPQVTNWFFSELLEIGFNSSQFVWNDVSGCYDENVSNFLKEFSGSRYILCHNRANSRSESSNHMNFVDDEVDIFSEIMNLFSQAKSKRVIFDPCFGFSKTFDQNLELIGKMGEFISSFPDRSWVFGVSKKSFLRRLWQLKVEPGLDLIKHKEELLEKSEFFHLHFMKEIMTGCRGSDISFRVHDPLLYKSSLFLTAEKFAKN